MAQVVRKLTWADFFVATYLLTSIGLLVILEVSRNHFPQIMSQIIQVSCSSCTFVFEMSIGAGSAPGSLVQAACPMCEQLNQVTVPGRTPAGTPRSNIPAAAAAPAGTISDIMLTASPDVVTDLQ